jgi:hypothetical protein
MDNASTALTTTDVMTKTNVPSIDVPLLDALTPQLFVTMEMLALMTDATLELENVFMLLVHLKAQTIAQSQLVMQDWELSILQRNVMMELHVLLILVTTTVDVSSLSIMLFVMTTILALLTLVFLEKDASTPQSIVMTTTLAQKTPV